MQSPLKRCRPVIALALVLGLAPWAWANGAPGASVQVNPVVNAPVMPPTALPPLPPLPGGVYSGPTGLPLQGFGTPQVPLRRAPSVMREYHPDVPPPTCPGKKVFVKAIVGFDHTSQADICANGILNPGMGVGDTVAGMRIIAIDANGVTVGGRKGRQRLSMSPR